MDKHSVKPVFVVPGVSVCTLDPLPRVHSKFDERFLQELLADHPELLPVNSIRSDVGELLCIGREVPVGRGSIDNLYISTRGYPVIVETKLWRNPEARREVFSQTLEYLKDLVRKDFEWFAAQWKSFSQQLPNQSMDLLSRLNELSGDELDEQSIVDRVNRALLRGDVIAMIVGDGIETNLQELVAHYCRDTAHFRYSLALVELGCYQFPNRDEAGFLVVPRIVQNVELVQRAYVRVELAEGLVGQLKVTPVVHEDTGDGQKRRVNLNEEDFLHAVESSVGAALRGQIEAFYNGLIESLQLEPEFKAAAVMLKLPHPDGDRVGASLLAFEKQGRIYNNKLMKPQLQGWGLNPGSVDRITSAYWNALHDIDHRFNPEGITHVAPSQFIPFAEVIAKLDDIKSAVSNVAMSIREEVEKMVE